MAPDDVKDWLPVIRMALEQHWAAWAVEKNRPDVATGATMCRYTSAFLVKVLGPDWEMAGGDPYFEGFHAGYCDGARWHPHYWVTDGEYIVDLTANQFHADPIVMVPVNDWRYAANYTEADIEEAVQYVDERTTSWAEDFQRQYPGFADLTNPKEPAHAGNNNLILKEANMASNLTRMWINQPSPANLLHSLHGTHVLAEPDLLDSMKVYFLSGDDISMRVAKHALSEGWPSGAPVMPEPLKKEIVEVVVGLHRALSRMVDEHNPDSLEAEWLGHSNELVRTLTGENVPPNRPWAQIEELEPVA